MISVGEHRLDGGKCDACGGVGRAGRAYTGTVVLPAAELGLDGRDMHEARSFVCMTCLRAARVAHVPRPDLDGEAYGWVIDRREPAPVVRPWDLPDFIAEPERGTVRPGRVWT